MKNIPRTKPLIFCKDITAIVVCNTEVCNYDYQTEMANTSCFGPQAPRQQQHDKSNHIKLSHSTGALGLAGALVRIALIQRSGRRPAKTHGFSVCVIALSLKLMTVGVTYVFVYSTRTDANCPGRGSWGPSLSQPKLNKLKDNYNFLNEARDYNNLRLYENIVDPGWDHALYQFCAFVGKQTVNGS